MKRIIVAALVICAFTVMTRPAVGFSGNDLHKWCMKRAESSEGLCIGYITGAYDLLVEMQRLNRESCVPEKVSVGRVVDVVRKYLAEHPEGRHESAPTIILGAVAKAWPCP